MGRMLETLDAALERVVTPLGYRPAPRLWVKLAVLTVFAALLAFGIMASWWTRP